MVEQVTTPKALTPPDLSKYGIRVPASREEEPILNAAALCFWEDPDAVQRFIDGYQNGSLAMRAIHRAFLTDTLRGGRSGKSDMIFFLIMSAMKAQLDYESKVLNHA